MEISSARPRHPSAEGCATERATAGECRAICLRGGRGRGSRKKWLCRTGSSSACRWLRGRVLASARMARCGTSDRFCGRRSSRRASGRSSAAGRLPRSGQAWQDQEAPHGPSAAWAGLRCRRRGLLRFGATRRLAGGRFGGACRDRCRHRLTDQVAQPFDPASAVRSGTLVHLMFAHHPPHLNWR